MKKLLAIALLAAFGLPFVSPVFALIAKTDTNLPACCRRNGKHHCMMSLSERERLVTRAPEFRAPVDKCPYCPAAVVFGSGTRFVPPPSQAIFAALIAHPAVFAQTRSKLRISRTRSRQKRGPPVVVSPL